jgi:hypothetical protein
MRQVGAVNVYREGPMQRVNAHTVAEAICRVSPKAGQSCAVQQAQTVEQRVENLLRYRDGYGMYIEDGDPKGWGGGRALVTIYMERIGGADDCELPLDSWGNGMEVGLRASQLLPGEHFIEFINAAVACVF